MDQSAKAPHSASDQTAADIEAGRKVLRTEADALTSAAAALDASFSKAVEILFRTKGRVIVSGMGKSGHVANKIAASLASTGTPAHYVHPAEASHGDLGMVTKADTLLMLSNSGENRELSDLVVHAKRSNVPLVAITSRGESALAKQADLVLVLPKAPEACPMGLAPTTSSTMMLALGDALAVALMGRRGFNQDDYRVLHPGGSLGQALLRVMDIMHTGVEVPLVGPEAAMRDVLNEMTSKRFGFTAVADALGNLIGIITDGDLRRHMMSDVPLENKKAKDIMTASPRSIGAAALVAEAVHEMNEGGTKQVTCLIVTEGQKPIGFVHMHDCLRAGVR